MSRTQPSIWKQLVGALLGSAFAVGGYMTYQYSSDTVRAYLIPPGYTDEDLPYPGIRLADAEPTQRNARLNARAREAVERMREIQKNGVVAAGSSSSEHMMAMVTSASSSAKISAPDPMTDIESAPMGLLPGGHAAAVLVRKDERLAAMLTQSASPTALPSSGPGLLVAAVGAVAGAVASRSRKKQLQ